MSRPATFAVEVAAFLANAALDRLPAARFTPATFPDASEECAETENVRLRRENRALHMDVIRLTRIADVLASEAARGAETVRCAEAILSDAVDDVIARGLGGGL